MGFRLPNGSELSAEQLDIINLPTTKNWVIKGAPGTGKTVMAVYRAAQVGEKSKGKPILMLVYNNPLRQFIATALRGREYQNVQVKTYHQWVSDIYKENQLGYVPKVEGDHDWEVIAEDMAGLGKKYAHVIVDEAQDFPVELLQILKDLSNNMTCFVDPNQAIEIGKTDTYDLIKTLCVESPYKLTKNFRNTKPIRDLSALFCIEGEPAPTDMPGKKPVAIKCIPRDFVDVDSKMADIIKRNKEKNIGIIVNPKSLNITYEYLKDYLPSDVTIQMHKSHTDYRIDFDKPGVKILTYGTMKGLEFDIVLLPLFDKIEMQDGGRVDANRVYVAITRAISELYVFYWSLNPSKGKICTMPILKKHSELLDWE